ncbi:MAG: hypothetical protein HN853_06380 [Halieaceae bacterium]|jgi:hypothetical protein|nr:hypothetical protein [Halieaceae bacterium]
MNITKIISIPVFTLLSSLSLADVSDDLIAMDKQWGMAGGPAGYVSEDVIGIGPTGVVNFGNLVADAAANANVGEEYVVSDYQVKFLSDDIAVMVHTAAGSDPHASLHVIQKQGDAWLVVATASAPAS